MKIKHQLAVFNLVSRLLIIAILWFVLPVLVEKVVYNHIDKSILEKKQKFIKQLDNEEIHDFMNRNDPTETFASFSTLHNEFLQLYRAKNNSIKNNSIFKNEDRIIENEQNTYRVLYYNFTYANKDYVLEIGNNLSEINELTYTIRWFTTIMFFIIVLITFLAETFYIEYLLKPFYKILNTKIKKVDEPKTFNFTKINSQTTEFQELDSVLNNMMFRINDLFQKEKQFIGNVSHELLTPISLLKNRFENLLQNESINDEGIDKIVSSLKILDLLKKIINNLLLISRIDNNQYLIDENVDVNETITEIIETIEDRIDEKQIAIKNELITKINCFGNKTLIHILIYNLILNAIKYNIKGGTVTLNSSEDNNLYILKITDTGVGISQELQATIFERFTRIDFNQEGQGLGLAIVDSIAKLHHITISVESQVNKGTTFVIGFPKKS